MNEMQALREAIAKVGGQVSMAKKLGLRSQGAISNWLTRSKRIPAEHVLAIEAVSGISRHSLRPDIYPREPRRRSELRAS